MKILHCVESYFPSKGGMQEVVKQLSERLVALGHELTVATSKHSERNFESLNGVKISGFAISGNLVRGIEGESERYRNYLLSSDADVIVFFAAQQWATDLALDILPAIKAKKVAVPTGYSGFYYPEFKSYFEKMRQWIKGYDMNVYLSDHYRDIDFARENGVKAITLIPNGAAADEFLKPTTIDVRKELNLSADAFLVLHVGSFTGRKGHREAIELFLRSKIKNGALLLVGNDYGKFWRQYIRRPKFGLLNLFKRPLKGPIIIGDYSREFTLNAFKQANLFLFPSNIECSPIVLFECAAAKLPFLCTDVGNATEIAAWTGGGKILPTEVDKDRFSFAKIDESVLMLNALYENETERNAMGERAFKTWQEKYSWEKIAMQYATLYSNLIK